MSDRSKSPTKNLAVEYLKSHDKTIDHEYDGWCGDLADDVSAWVDGAVKILHIKPVKDSLKNQDRHGAWLHKDVNDNKWRFHIVPVVGGIVHDAWNPELLLPPDEYAAKAFPGKTTKLTILREGETVGDQSGDEFGRGLAGIGRLLRELAEKGELPNA